MSFHHYRENQAVEHDVVFSNEVYKACFLILPPFLPAAPTLRFLFTKFLGVGDIAYRCVKPYVEHLAFCPFHRNRNTPVKVAGHGTRLQIHVEPALALSIYIGAPFFVPLQNPLFQPILVFPQRQIPVLGRLLDQSMTRVVLVSGIDEFVWRKRGTAFFTLVAISSLCSTAWTCTHNVAVGEKFACLLVAVLQFGVLLQFAFVIKGAEEIGSKLVVNLGGCAAIDIKRNAKILKRFLDEIVIAVYYLLYADAFLPCTDSDRYTMLIAAANEHNLLFLEAQVAYINVCWYIYTGQMANMHTTVGIRERSRNGGSLKFLFHKNDRNFIMVAKLRNYCQ